MYTFTKTLSDTSFEEAVTRTREALSAKGFGILTEIDVKKTMKVKLNADLEDYMILGACNPAMAYKAIEIEPRVGAMLPCNVIVRSIGDRTVEVSAIDPVASMSAISNPELHAVAGEVAHLLRSVVQAI
ncbi:MAG: DUF302 domain-containing protein [Devosia sp.]|nr:DUF302 domain-containing protein [Devosia sp.]